MISHGETSCGAKYLTTMARQLGLKRDELVSLVECPLMTIPFAQARARRRAGGRSRRPRRPRRGVVRKGKTRIP